MGSKSLERQIDLGRFWRRDIPERRIRVANMSSRKCYLPHEVCKPLPEQTSDGKPQQAKAGAYRLSRFARSTDGTRETSSIER